MILIACLPLLASCSRAAPQTSESRSFGTRLRALSDSVATALTRLQDRLKGAESDTLQEQTDVADQRGMFDSLVAVQRLRTTRLDARDASPKLSCRMPIVRSGEAIDRGMPIIKLDASNRRGIIVGSGCYNPLAPAPDG